MKRCDRGSVVTSGKVGAFIYLLVCKITHKVFTARRYA